MIKQCKSGPFVHMYEGCASLHSLIVALASVFSISTQYNTDPSVIDNNLH